MRVLRISVVEFAEYRFPVIRLVIREMGVAFHFRVDMRQIQFLRFRQELLINATAANHHDFWYVTTRRNGFIHRLHPRYAIVRTRLTAEDNIFASWQRTTD